MIDGILPIHKDKGYTSHDVVAKLRGILRQKKIGHTGTLDPDATGVLPVCLGAATKISDMLSSKSKEYITTMLLGTETDTQDISGNVLKLTEYDVDTDTLTDIIYSFKGKYMQEPPMYSALKVDGKKLVDLARQGIVIERKKREVEIFEIEILDISLPEVKMRVDCSKGTYIRTLCHDIGKALSIAACMKDLIRTRHDRFSLDECISLDAVQNLSREELERHIISVEEYFTYLIRIDVKSEYHRYAVNGNKIQADYLEDSSIVTRDKWIRLYSQDIFMGIYEYIEAEKAIKPVNMFYHM